MKPFLLAITPILFFLLLWNLGNQYLWYDEAQNAVLARSTLRHGYPKAIIGEFFVATEETYGPGSSYVAQPWLQNYVCALAFLLFGESAWSARILFAIFGIFSFYLFYALSNRLFKDKFTSRLALFIGVTSVPFLLHLRQSRYYSLTVFFTLALLLSYLKFLEREKYSSFLFIAASFFLFHANFGSAIPVLGAVLIHFFLTMRKRVELIRSFSVLYAWIFFLILPWGIFYRIWAQGAAAENLLPSILSNAKFYLSKINGYFFPYRFLFIVILASLAFRKIFFKKKLIFTLEPAEKNALSFMILIIVVNWVFLWFADFSSVRYFIHIASLFFIIEGFVLKRLLIWNKFFGTIFLFLLCFTDLFNTSIFPLTLQPAIPAIYKVKTWAYNKGVINERYNKKISKELGKLRDKAGIKMYFFDYLYEITHDYDGPMEGVVKYLLQNAKPGETVKTHSFNANSLFFYTNLKIDRDFSNETYPEWIFLRDYWTEEAFYNAAYFKSIEKKYKKIELDYPDIWWENRPDDLSHHHFRTAPLDKKISIYKRIR